MDKGCRISPSLLAADFANLEKDIRRIENDSDYLHIDVMDGHYVPNISVGIPVVEAVHRITALKLDVHLMISNPDPYIEPFIKAGANPLTVHYETCTHLSATMMKIKRFGVEAFVSLNPHTPVTLLNDIIHEVDGVLLMSVNPGFGGQAFIPHTYEKVKQLDVMRKEKHLSFLISVDGGINASNFLKLYELGADILVAGSAIFSSKNPSQTIRDWKNDTRNCH
jgi:ribulose-phosphate 3-epimerase